MTDFDKWVTPTAKKWGKFPRVDITKPDGAKEYTDWLNEHTEIDRRVPPIFRDFVISYSFNYPKIVSGSSRDNLQFEDYTQRFEQLVHYNDDYTAFRTVLRIDDRSAFTADVDYNLINDLNVHADVYTSQPVIDKYGGNWIKQTSISACLLAVAVQAFLLYFRPEVVEQIYTPSEAPRPEGHREPSRKPKRRNVEPIRVRKSVVRRIVLNPADKPPKVANYRKLQWHVRGHYRHVGRDKKLKYIQPFVCSRGGKLVRRTYQM